MTCDILRRKSVPFSPQECRKSFRQRQQMLPKRTSTIKIEKVWSRFSYINKVWRTIFSHQCASSETSVALYWRYHIQVETSVGLFYMLYTKIHTKEEMARSHPETWFITENNVRRTNRGEEGLQETKNNTFGLATEDRGRQYQLRRTKDVRPGQV